EPYLLLAEKRLYHSLYGGDEKLNSKDELLEILYEARRGIVEHHDGLFLELLDEFILKIKVFGFHFASLDIRQDSRKHDDLWKGIISESAGEKSLSQFNKLDEEEQIAKLFEFQELPDADAMPDSFHGEMLKTLDAISYIQEQSGEMGCHRYVISNAQSVYHIISVYQLAKLRLAPDGPLKLDIVPLFETIDDLLNAPEVMRRLYESEVYRDHLRSREDKQTIMVGFSDGTKDGGYLRANWSIFRAKEELTKVSRQYGVNVVFFDGRGGPPARGGGNMHNFYASLGQKVENEEIQITIQGQTISA